jgi:hypothetical protein
MSVTIPAVSMLSFTVNGTPCSGPRWPAGTASAARASCSASSARTTSIARRRPSTAPMRARCASTTSTADASRVRMSCASRTAG